MQNNVHASLTEILEYSETLNFSEKTDTFPFWNRYKTVKSMEVLLQFHLFLDGGLQNVISWLSDQFKPWMDAHWKVCH